MATDSGGLGPTYAKPPGEDTFFLGRLMGMRIFVGLLLAIVLLRLAVLMLRDGDAWMERAEANFLRPRDIPPARGDILDRDGAGLAINRPVFDIGIVRYRQREEDLRAALAMVAATAPPGSTIPTLDHVLASNPSWREVSLLRGLSPEEATPILEALGHWDFLRYHRRPVRHYPLGRGAAHLIGYLRLIPPELEEEYFERGYERDDLIGWTGIERAWEDYLRGGRGREIRRSDALHRELGVELAEGAVPGATLRLSIDADMQRAAWSALEGERGAIVALDPRDGAVLAIASSPSFDPETRRLVGTDSEFNRAIGSATAPASTAKIFTGLAMLENGLPRDGSVWCPGYFKIPNWRRPFYCAHRGGHGRVTLRTMLKTSCNVYVYDGAYRLGAGRLAEVFDRFGFGRPTGFGAGIGGRESAGALPSPGTMMAGETVLLGIGQGPIAVTPMQLASAVATFANGGVWYRPYVVDEVIDRAGEQVWRHRPEGHSVRLDRAHRAAIIEGMRAVTQEPGGTAWEAEFPREWDVAGKSGTAQRGDTPDAWFVCFAPASAPRVVVVVRIEEGGGGGSVAGPAAREVLAAMFDTPGESGATASTVSRADW